MAGTAAADWDPAAYARFHDLRLQPARDLLARIGAVPPGDVVDLGCGNGAVGPDLRARFADRCLVGLDASPAMIEGAAATGVYDALRIADAAAWAPDRPVALIFSNAALQWLGDHDRLFLRLAEILVPGGILAVQMPRQHGAPSHRLLRDLSGQPDAPSAVGTPDSYHHLLQPFGAVQVWETIYLQRLAPVARGHPVRAFTQATAMRPFLAGRDAADSAAFIARYDAALAAAYPPAADGSDLFPFRRLFLTLMRDPAHR
jgi:trans-aconitate 2-methyltransferase